MAVMAAMSVLMLANMFAYLVVVPDGAIDLRYYYRWVQEWFARYPVYRGLDRPEYPPASLVLLWPLVGWMSWPHARLLWAIGDLAALAGLLAILVRGAAIRAWRARVFVALMLLSMTPTGATIGNGQLTLKVLLPATLAVLLLVERPPSWVRDGAVATLIVISLVKPSVSAPFLCLACLGRGVVRPLVIAFAAYAALTVLAMSFQDGSAVELIATPLRNGVGNSRVVDGNVHFLLRLLRLPPLILPASATILAALAAWTYRHRDHDFWLLLAVAAMVARIWTYHRIYDSVLVVYAELALLRIASRACVEDRLATLAGTLLAGNVIAFVSPGRGGIMPFPYNAIIEGTQAVFVAIDLAFLLWYVHSRPVFEPGAARADRAPASRRSPGWNRAPAFE
jgi:hypothetical protein